MIKKLVSAYMPGFAKSIVYMLQNVEYESRAFWQWYDRTKDFSKVMIRRKLVKTKVATALWLFLVLGMLFQVLVGVWFAYRGNQTDSVLLSLYGLILILTYPFVWVRLIIVALIAGRLIIVRPLTAIKLQKAKKIFATSKAIKIAVVGSYGKTTMKELLGTVLSEGKKVAITPANKNVLSSHANFAMSLTGDEDILVIEYGEGSPGDIAKMARLTKPDGAVITGIAPAHLDKYPTMQSVYKDIFSIKDYIDTKYLYINGDIHDLSHAPKTAKIYSPKSVNGWKITDVKVGFEGVRFVMKKGSNSMHLHSGLLGEHQVGPLAAVASIADELGLTKHQIEKGIATTTAFEHRMQARPLRGAWILDDTYNGNIEGMRAGLELLKTLPAKRRIYVTPGLVDQGVETEKVHHELGRAIAEAAPDVVVLMQNSVTKYIQKGLLERGYRGIIQTEDNPLEFYTNIDHIIAAGDVIVMQNDWPDNYN